MRVLLPLAALAVAAASAQTPVPANPSHGTSPWGVYHANSYAQASTPARGPEAGDALRGEYLPAGRINRASPWTVLGRPYADGSVPIWGVTLTHVLKSVQYPDGRVEVVDTERIDYNLTSIKWNFMALADGKIYVMDPARRRILRFADETPGEPTSGVVRDGVFPFPDGVEGTSAHLNVTYDGWIVVPTDRGEVFAVRPDFAESRVASFTIGNGDTVGHNAFPIDQDGGIYLATQDGMTKVRWTGDRFRLEWEAPYRFRNPGCPEPESPLQDLQWTLEGNPCSGGGTTPTLMGVGPREDHLVLAVDGHQPNQLVAFWRDEIPSDWAGLPGQDRRVAAITPAPFATAQGRGFNTENSPTAWGYEIAFAQWNGISNQRDPVPGVQKFRWDPARRSLDVVWSTDQVALNNVLTYADGSGLVYGTGLRGDVFHFWALDWQTGRVVIELPLGRGTEWTDGGNQLTVLPDRSLAYGSGEAGLARIVVGRGTAEEPVANAAILRLRVVPNPARDQISVTFELGEPGDVELTLRDIRGRQVAVIADGIYSAGEQRVAVSTDRLTPGSYIVRLRTGTRSTARRFVRIR